MTTEELIAEIRLALEEHRDLTYADRKTEQPLNEEGGSLWFSIDATLQNYDTEKETA